MSSVSPAPITGRRGGRPTVQQAARLDRLVHECALEQFLVKGYEGTSMGAVAAAAGTTKASLYARFPSKEAMFVAVLDWASARRDWPIQDAEPAYLDDVHDLAGLTAILGDIAAASLRRALHPKMIQLTRLAAAYGARFPELARRSRLSPWRRYDLLVELLRRLRAEGVLTTDEDPEILAEHFFAMVSGMPARMALFGVVRPARVQERRTESAVRLFVDGICR